MSIDLTAVYGLVGSAVAITLVFLFIRIDKWEEMIPELIKQSEAWLGEIQTRLGNEVNTVVDAGAQQDKVDSVVSIASQFSAVKSINTELDRLEVDNSARGKGRYRHRSRHVSHWCPCLRGNPSRPEWLYLRGTDIADRFLCFRNLAYWELVFLQDLHSTF